ncbi:MAG: hypothetical protein RL693_2507 [Verrucomicrobiota bacterium]|jgi:hypothetical protein
MLDHRMKFERPYFSTPWVILGVFIIFTFCGRAQAQITTRSDNVGKLLNQWHAEGTAAGLGALIYENRDGGHSLLDLKTYPQLRHHVATDEEKASKRDIGPASLVRQFPVLGNCSMAAPADKGGSLPRIYLSAQQGFDFLGQQYLHNNLYFYPEHQDYDPGYNGQGGWGDLYPANTPYLTISQGSSFSDQPFLQAFLSTAAAFPPETQELLIRSHALAPTLQSIFRKSNRMVKTEEDYLKGKAHPPVFDAAQIDEEKMILLAHGMTRLGVPPLVVLEMLKEDAGVPNRDFFETTAIKDEKLGTTPFSIARIFRGSGGQRQYSLSARKSVDFMSRPLALKWVLLQGDPEKVKIKPSSDGVNASITVDWHPALQASNGIPSHRVDIGAFANNGMGWSAPAIFSIYMLPNESRFYDEKGNLMEICYEAGNPDPGMPATTDLRWLTLGRRLAPPSASPAMRWFKQKLPEEATSKLIALADELAPLQDEWRALSREADKKPGADALLLKIQDQLRTRLGTPLKDNAVPLAEAVARAISAMADTTDLYLAHQDEIAQLAAASIKTTAPSDLAQARKRLLDFQIFQQTDKGTMVLRPEASRLSKGEHERLREFHLTLLSQVLLPEFLERSTAPAFVDFRLSAPKAWRDVYHYDAAGKCTGWSRLTHGRSYEFDREGHLLPEGPGGPAVEVSYVIDEPSGRLVFIPK